MASNSSGSGSQGRAPQRLRIIAGHLQRPVDVDATVSAAECKAQGGEADVASDGKSVPKRRYKAVMERWTRGPSSVALASHVVKHQRVDM